MSRRFRPRGQRGWKKGIGNRDPAGLLDEVPRRVHAFVQHAHHQHTVVLRHVKHSVRSKRITPQTCCKLLHPRPDLGILAEIFEASEQVVQVVPRLPQAEIRD